MNFSMDVKPSCQKAIDKLCKKNSLLREILRKKMEEIMENPFHYKPLRYELAGERRVHIMKSFVLKYEIKDNIVIFLAFRHHDDVYER